MNALSIRNLTKQYGNGFQALSGIDLDVAAGDFFALLGPNGAGKSTTIGIITGLVNKTEGSVEVFGHNTDTHLAEAKRCIGLVPQEFNFNVFEPIREVVINQAGYYGIARREASKRAEFYLKKLDLWDKRDDSARELSGGMKRRLMIARALVHQPKLLILDEPTAGVDIEIRRSMWESVQDINKQDGITIILTTHYLEEAEEMCDEIAIINQGTLIARDSTKNLLGQLDSRTIVIDPSERPDTLPDVDHVRIETRDDGTLAFHYRASDISADDVLDAVRNAGIRIRDVRTEQPDLEDVFLKLTRAA